MDQHSIEPRDISRWSVLPIGARIRIGGRLGWIRGRYFRFAIVGDDGEAKDEWHVVPIGRCVESMLDKSP